MGGNSMMEHMYTDLEALASAVGMTLLDASSTECTRYTVRHKGFTLLRAERPEVVAAWLQGYSYSESQV
jgi:hypothetical protein